VGGAWVVVVGGGGVDVGVGVVEGGWDVDGSDEEAPVGKDAEAVVGVG
jgi:hypothetical protein